MLTLGDGVQLMADRDLLGAERRASVLFVTWRNLHTLCSYCNPMSESGRPLAAQHHLAKFVGSPRKNVHVESGDQTLQFLQSSRDNDRQPCSGGRVGWQVQEPRPPPRRSSASRAGTVLACIDGDPPSLATMCIVSIA